MIWEEPPWGLLLASLHTDITLLRKLGSQLVNVIFRGSTGKCIGHAFNVFQLAFALSYLYFQPLFRRICLAVAAVILLHILGGSKRWVKLHGNLSGVFIVEIHAGEVLHSLFELIKICGNKVALELQNIPFLGYFQLLPLIFRSSAYPVGSVGKQAVKVAVPLLHAGCAVTVVIEFIQRFPCGLAVGGFHQSAVLGDVNKAEIFKIAVIIDKNGVFSPAAEIIVTGGHYFGDKLCKGIAVQLVGSDIVGAASTEKPLPCKYGKCPQKCR